MTPGAPGRGSPTRRFDTSPLTERVPLRELRAFWREFSQVPGARQPGRGARIAVVVIGALVVPIGLLAFAVGISEELAEGAPDMVGQLIGMGALMLLLAFAGIVLTWAALRMGSRRRSRRAFFRLARFAGANGLSFFPGVHDGRHLAPWRERGMVRVVDLMRARGGRAVEFANVEIQSSAGHRSSTTFGGYAATRVGTPLPHIRLESRRIVRTSTGVTARDQRLSLEGDFDRFFALSCPRGYETDALYLFTPDVMARLVDSVADFDLELVDDWVFLTSPDDVVTLKPERWQAVVSAFDAVLAKIGQWERWRDDRVPHNRLSAPGRVAASGRRLRMTWGAGAVLGAMGFAVFVSLTVIANAVG